MRIISVKSFKISIIILLMLTPYRDVTAQPDSNLDEVSVSSSSMRSSSPSQTGSDMDAAAMDVTFEDEDDALPASMSSGRVWNKPGIPHTGWTHLGVERLEEANGVCQMCDQTHIRFMHEVAHPKHPNLQVGVTCADHMTSSSRQILLKAERASKKAFDQAQKERARQEAAQRQRELRIQEESAAAQRREQAAQLKKQTHRQKWVSLESWRQSDRGNYVNSVKPGQTITIFKKGIQWSYVSNEQFSIRKFNTPQEAAEASYAQWFH